MNDRERKELVQYRINRAKDTLNEVNIQTHAGVRQLFGLHFVKKGLISRDSAKFYTDIFDKRQISDYEDYLEFNRELIFSCSFCRTGPIACIDTRFAFLDIDNLILDMYYCWVLRKVG